MGITLRRLSFCNVSIGAIQVAAIFHSEPCEHHAKLDTPNEGIKMKRDLKCRIGTEMGLQVVPSGRHFRRPCLL